jgi:hypothetical protein
VLCQVTSFIFTRCALSSHKFYFHLICYVKSQVLFSFDLLCQVTSFIFIRFALSSRQVTSFIFIQCALSSHKIYFHPMCFVKSQDLFSFDLLCQVTRFIFIRCALSSHKICFHPMCFVKKFLAKPTENIKKDNLTFF